MTQQEFLARLVKVLESVGIPYMVAGSLASGLHGEPRNTYDCDVVIDPTPEQLQHLLDSFGNGEHDLRRNIFPRTGGLNGLSA